MLRFTIRDVLWLTVVVGLVVSLLYAKRPIHPGRYQFVEGPGVTKYVIDTTTGTIWRYDEFGEWHEFPSPPLPK